MSIIILLDPVLCEDVIRLEHALTKRNMHTHDIKAPLSGKQEVILLYNMLWLSNFIKKIIRLDIGLW